MVMNTWIVVAGDPGVRNLVATARELGGQVRAVVIGTRQVADTLAASGVDEVIWIEQAAGVPIEAYACAVPELVRATPGVLISGRRPAERVVLGAAAAALHAPVITGASTVSIEDDEVLVTHSAFGGISEQTIAVAGPVALILDGGGLPPAGEPVAVSRQDAAPRTGVAVAQRIISTADRVDLGSATRVIGVGRGLRQQADLALIENLAKALKAEIGCTRPLAEGLDWLPRDRYIGISGQHIAPRLYLAVGLSGQLQHLDGVRGAEVVVSVNNDPRAPICEQADYVLVTDLYEFVPALAAELAG